MDYHLLESIDLLVFLAVFLCFVDCLSRCSSLLPISLTDSAATATAAQLGAARATLTSRGIWHTGLNKPTNTRSLSLFFWLACTLLPCSLACLRPHPKHKLALSRSVSLCWSLRTCRAATASSSARIACHRQRCRAKLSLFAAASTSWAFNALPTVDKNARQEQSRRATNSNRIERNARACSIYIFIFFLSRNSKATSTFLIHFLLSNCFIKSV